MTTFTHRFQDEGIAFVSPSRNPDDFDWADLFYSAFLLAECYVDDRNSSHLYANGRILSDNFDYWSEEDGELHPILEQRNSRLRPLLSSEDTVIVYRGFNGEYDNNPMEQASWSLNRDWAVWFAKKDGNDNAFVATLEVPISKILATFAREDECLVNTYNLDNVDWLNVVHQSMLSAVNVAEEQATLKTINVNGEQCVMVIPMFADKDVFED
ncbi:hypothetical protein HVY71_12535 [Citrobacter freundii]|uniref:hypothetical protein n=1 Tax=Citrobacter portucalensis TaxID=1639133 RepID=UPI0015E9926F|nr:hypothetical protein HVY71_12535 [Citrobacter freundii]